MALHATYAVFFSFTSVPVNSPNKMIFREFRMRSIRGDTTPTELS